MALFNYKHLTLADLEYEVLQMDRLTYKALQDSSEDDFKRFATIALEMHDEIDKRRLALLDAKLPWLEFGF